MGLIINKALVAVDGADVTAGLFPRLALFGEPDERLDTGWNFFTGLETDVEQEDPETFTVCSVRLLLRLHPATEQLLRVGVEGGWGWDDRRGRYEVEQGWQLEP